ncbi:cytochrome P450 [Rhizoctonia solani]|uniref:Cytochrome P450 n=1 Tax=Rhizoctonia solani TaxID=456999 RepID=A0A8H7I3D3_9AGAM|nr:cytochrome P450 [Rhizoctonia solani]
MRSQSISVCICNSGCVQRRSCAALLARVFGRKLRHPPAPRSLPFIGNIFSVPPGLDYLGYFELGKRLGTLRGPENLGSAPRLAIVGEHSGASTMTLRSARGVLSSARRAIRIRDIIYMDMMGKPAIVLNTAQAASDLLEKRSAIYSDRRSALMAKSASLCVQGHLALSITTNDRLILLPVRLDWSGFIPSLSYSDQWRRQRRRMNNWLNMRAVRQFDGIQQEAVQRLLGRLLEIPESQAPFNLRNGYAMFKLAYGYRLKSDQDPFFLDAIKATDNLFRAMMRNNFFVNAFPILEYVPDWLPGAGWKKTARKWREQKNHAVTAPYEWTKHQVASGDFEPSVLSALLHDDPAAFDISMEEREEELKELGYVLFAGGTDTSATALVNFVAAAMVIKPEVQAKAQAEVDSVLGSAVRLPTIADQSQMPYVRNLIQEVMRWQPVTPTGAILRSFTYIDMDDVYQGYDIQKGTIMGMTRDESVYEDPGDFNPDRFLDPNVPVAPGFGWGRRICPGSHFAEASLFLSISSLLATYNFSRKKDKNGKEIIPTVEVP